MLVVVSSKRGEPDKATLAGVAIEASQDVGLFLPGTGVVGELTIVWASEVTGTGVGDAIVTACFGSSFLCFFV